MLAASVHSGLLVEAEPCREAWLLDIRDLLTVMGAAGGAACSGGGEQKARSKPNGRAEVSLFERVAFLITRKVNPQSMKM